MLNIISLSVADELGCLLGNCDFLLEKIIDDHRLPSVASSMIFIIGDDHRVCSYDRRFESEAMIIAIRRSYLGSNIFNIIASAS